MGGGVFRQFVAIAAKVGVADDLVPLVVVTQDHQTFAESLFCALDALRRHQRSVDGDQRHNLRETQIRLKPIPLRARGQGVDQLERSLEVTDGLPVREMRNAARPRKLPVPVSFKFVTCTTTPPRPPIAKRP